MTAQETENQIGGAPGTDDETKAPAANGETAPATEGNDQAPAPATNAEQGAAASETVEPTVVVAHVAINDAVDAVNAAKCNYQEGHEKHGFFREIEEKLKALLAEVESAL